jgi:XTP/dITP diphosphohydrolase
MKVILSTRNPSKAEQIKEIFSGSSVVISTLTDAGIEGEAVENGTTLEENAIKKARFARERSNSSFWTIGDDTGLFINALNSEPGIYAARWAGEGAETLQIMQYCLDRMRDIENRSAIFRTAVAVVSNEGKEYIFTGEVHGHLLEFPRTDSQPKMPYSALFVPEGQYLCWAEMTTEYENAISHRGKAFRKVKDFLEGLLI